MPRHKNSTGHNGFLEKTKSGRYRGTITVANKKYRKVFTPNERESQKLLSSWARSMVETKGKKRNGVEKTKADDMFSCFESLYKASKKIDVKTISYYKIALNTLKEWMLWKGHVNYLEDITERDVAKFIHDEFDGNVSRRTAQLKIHMLGAAFKIICGKEIRCPFSGFSATGISSGKEPYKYALLTDDELKRLVSAAKTFSTKLDYYGFYLTGIYTGLRSSDVSRLSLSHIDFKNRIITIVPKKTKRMEKEVVIPIHPILFAYLTSRKANMKEGELFFGSMTHWKVMNANRRIFKNAGISQEIFVGDDGKKYKKSFHSFRVTMASKLGNSGCPLPVAISIMGHSVTMFLHYFRRDNDVAKSFINKAWSGVNLTGFGNTDFNNEEEE